MNPTELKNFLYDLARDTHDNLLYVRVPYIVDAYTAKLAGTSSCGIDADILSDMLQDARRASNDTNYKPSKVAAEAVLALRGNN